MEDLICPECGRPNLSEAKKCWYCQTELIQPTSSQGDEQPETEDIPTVKTDTPQNSQTQEETEENIPEWLLNIRKRIESDRGPEEELPYWKQKDIFGGEKKITDKTTREKKNTRTKKTKQLESDIKTEEDEKTSTKKETKNADKIDSANKTQDAIPEDLSDDLPDGFVKL